MSNAMYSIRIFSWILSLLIFLTIVLPTGSILSLNYKIGIIVLLVPFFIYICLFYGVRDSFIIWLFMFLIFLGFTFLVSYIYDVNISSVISHAVAFFSLFSILYFSLFIISYDEKYNDEFKNLILFSLIIFSVVKVSVSLLISLEFADPVLVQAFLKSVFNFEFIGLDATYFYRVHLPIDYLLPLMYLYVTFLSNDNRWFKYKRVFQLVIFMAILVSYSRMLYFIFIILFVLIYLDYIRKLKGEFFYISLLLAVCFLSLIVFLSFDFVYERYFGEMAVASDGPRLGMYQALISLIEEYTLFGKGLGSGAESLVRFEEMPWYYELQWLSFFAQFGIIGFIFLLSIALLPFLFIDMARLKAYSLFIYILYVAWLTVGFFNGFMLTSSASVIFLFFILMLLDQDIYVNHPLTICKDRSSIGV